MTHLGRWLSALVDGELDGAERDHVLSHLARCEACLGEANALRALKRRMGGLGEAAADSAMTSRLIGLAGPDWRPPGHSGQRYWFRPVHWFGGIRTRARIGRDLGQPLARPAWKLIVGAAATALTVVGAAAFLLGGSAQSPAPRITPAVDAYWTQHGFDTGQAPARPAAPTGHGPGSRSRP